MILTAYLHMYFLCLYMYNWYVRMVCAIYKRNMYIYLYNYVRMYVRKYVHMYV